MSQPTETGTEPEKADGRSARRQRNIDAVLDVVLEMFAEESLFPTMEQAAKRSGLSLRSLYRYFADPGELLEAVIVRNRQVSQIHAHLPAIGQGPLDGRIADFVTMRLRLHKAIGVVYRATVANAARHKRTAEELALTRDELREQFEQQFAPELIKFSPSERQRVTAAGDVLTQLDSIDFLCRHRKLTQAETERALVHGLRSLFER